MDASRSRSTLNRRGQALSEYAILVAMVGMGLVVILGLFGRATKSTWQKSESQFAAGDPSAPSAPSSAPAGSGVVVSGSVQPTPPPSSAPAPSDKPKHDSSDSSSAAADSLGGAPDQSAGVTTGR